MRPASVDEVGVAQQRAEVVQCQFSFCSFGVLGQFGLQDVEVLSGQFHLIILVCFLEKHHVVCQMPCKRARSQVDMAFLAHFVFIGRIGGQVVLEVLES